MDNNYKRTMFGTIPSRGVLTSDARHSGKISYGGKPGKGEPVSLADDCSAASARETPASESTVNNNNNNNNSSSNKGRRDVDGVVHEGGSF